MPAAKSPRVISTAREAIQALDGVDAVARMFGFDNTNRIYNWYERGLPPETYSTLAPILRMRGYQFSDDLFQQYPLKARKPFDNGSRGDKA